MKNNPVLIALAVVAAAGMAVAVILTVCRLLTGRRRGVDEE